MNRVERLPADHGTGQREQGIMNIRPFFIAQSQTTPVKHPLEEGFNDVPIFSEATAMLTIAFGDKRDNAAPLQRTTNFVVGIIGAIRQQEFGTPAWATHRLLDGRHGLDHGHGHFRVVNVGPPVCRIAKGRALAIGQDVALRARLTATHGLAPVFALQKRPGPSNCPEPRPSNRELLNIEMERAI